MVERVKNKLFASSYSLLQLDRLLDGKCYFVANTITTFNDHSLTLIVPVSK